MADIVQFPDGRFTPEKQREEEYGERLAEAMGAAFGIRDVQPYIDECKPVWETEGNVLQQLRMAKGLTVKEVADGLCISPGRVKRLEAGEPVNDAMLLKKAYMLFLTHQSTKPGAEVTQ